MDFSSIDALRSVGFSGFCSVSDLRESDCAAIPEAPGVYLICRDSVDRVEVLTESPAGFYKNRNPTISVTELESRLTPDSVVLYIGKASGSSPRSTLRHRIRTYLRHGAGHRAGHWGGRAIWQLHEANTFLVAWRIDASPRDLEKRLIDVFRSRHGNWPFANRTS